MKQRKWIVVLVLMCMSVWVVSVWPARADGVQPVAFLPLVRRDVDVTPNVTPQPTLPPAPTAAPVPTATSRPSQPPNPPGGIPWCPGSTGTTRVGAICNDGTSSSSTGSGTCSRHGGVRCWIGR
jgi:hypothetical protein